MGKIVDKGFKVLEVAALKSAPWNYKKENSDDGRLLEKLKNNIKKNGMIENLIVRVLDKKHWEVVNGNHRLVALQELGIKEVQVYDLGDIPLKLAKRIAIETNETKFEADRVKLAALLDELSDGWKELDDLKDTLPFSDDEMDVLKNLKTFDWDAYSKPGEGTPGATTPGVKDGGEGFKKIEFNLPESVAEQFLGQVSRFKKALYPNEKDEKKVSYVLPIEAMIQHLAQLPDEQLV